MKFVISPYVFGTVVYYFFFHILQCTLLVLGAITLDAYPTKSRYPGMNIF